MKFYLTAFLSLLAAPSFAASGPFVSLKNTDFVVLVAFLIFVGILLFYKVPKMVSKMLDERASSIQSELNEARALREEAQSLLASYERKHKDLEEQTSRIVASAKHEAEQSALQAKEEIESSIARRLSNAEDQIKAAQSAAVKDIRNQAINVSVAVASEVLAKQMDAKMANGLIDASIDHVSSNFH